MGIKGLMKLISDNVPSAIKEKDISAFFGRKIAIDASMALYQFLIAVRNGAENEMLTNENGEVTSHLQGLFYRTLRMLDAGIKPVYVFDGKPPQLKGGELAERKEKREEAEEKLKAATEAENQEEMNKYAKRLVHVTKEHNSEARRLLRAMGIPVVEAPGEAEAQCAQLAKEGKVFGVATEDMDALTFGTPVLLRHLSASAARKLPIVEIHLNTVLNGLKLSQEEFVDLCILCGCDYTGSIKGIGPAKAYQLIQTHKSIEKALNYVDKNKYKVPDDFLYKEAAQLFHTPEVHHDSIQLQWTDPNEDELIKFLVDEKGFNLERVTSGIKRLKASKNKGAQQRMDTFFKMPAPSKPISSSSYSSSSSSNKLASIVKKEEDETVIIASKSIEEKSSTASESSSSLSPKKSRSKKVIKEEEEETSSISLTSAAAPSPIKPAKNEKSPQKKTSTAPSAKATAWASFFAPKAKSKTAVKVEAETVKTEEDDDDSMDIEKKKPKRRLIDDEGEAELQLSAMETVKAVEVEEEPKKKKGRPASPSSPKRRSTSPKPE